MLVLHRDERLLAVRKPAGVHVHRSEFDPDEPALVETLEERWGLKLFPVHRLDRPTSGALLFALDREAASVLGAAFRERAVSKEYHAVVRGWLPATHADTPVQRDRRDPERLDAETLFAPLESYELLWPRRGFDTFRCMLVRAEPVTGRRHQIRQHCDDLRHPIVGDTVWGDTGMNGWFSKHLQEAGLGPVSLHLWCRSMTFPHPDGGTITVESPLFEAEEARLALYRRLSLKVGD